MGSVSSPARDARIRCFTIDSLTPLSLCVKAPEMNYRKIYDRLIERAKARARPGGYCEEHHIVPTCVGGSDDKSNLVFLTAKEHFIAHVLLARSEGGKHWAAVKILGEMYGFRNSRSYKLAKEHFSKHNPSKLEKNKQKLSLRMKQNNPMKNKMVAEKMSRSRIKMYEKDPALRAAISGDNNVAKREDVRKKMSVSAKNRRKREKEKENA